jgi:hypothetical protein
MMTITMSEREGQSEPGRLRRVEFEPTTTARDQVELLSLHVSRTSLSVCVVMVIT